MSADEITKKFHRLEEYSNFQAEVIVKLREFLERIEQEPDSYYSEHQNIAHQALEWLSERYEERPLSEAQMLGTSIWSGMYG